MKSAAIIAIAVVATAACTPITPERAADRCEERARAAQGPEVGLQAGMNSQTGGFGAARISLSTDYLAGRDPLALYESCVIKLTGEPPIRPLRLRAGGFGLAG